MQKTYSQIKPKDFDIEKADESGMSTVLFFDNIEEIQTEEDTLYSYYMYKIKVPSRPNLEQTIEQQYFKWLEKAKDETKKELSTKIREKRNKLLAETDWTHVTDSALSKEEKEKYKVYRQELRDITKQEGFPFDVEFPSM